MLFFVVISQIFFMTASVNGKLYTVKTIVSTGTTSDAGTLVINRDGVDASKGAIFLYAYDANNNYWIKLYGFTKYVATIGVCNFNNNNAANEMHTVYSAWLVPLKYT